MDIPNKKKYIYNNISVIVNFITVNDKVQSTYCFAWEQKSGFSRRNIKRRVKNEIKVLAQLARCSGTAGACQMELVLKIVSSVKFILAQSITLLLRQEIPGDRWNIIWYSSILGDICEWKKWSEKREFIPRGLAETNLKN